VRGARVDDNQTLIVDCLRRCGCQVEVLSRLGRGVPDLLVGTPRGQLVLIEVKDGAKIPSRRQLTSDQERWHAEWRRFPVFVVSSVVEAVDAIGHDCTSFDVGRDGRRTCSACHRELRA
jgi:hypothetical protein